MSISSSLAFDIDDEIKIINFWLRTIKEDIWLFRKIKNSVN